MDINHVASAVQSTAIYSHNFKAFLVGLGVPPDVVEQMDPDIYVPKLSMIYVALGIANESGEALSAVKKWLRGDTGYIDARERFAKENRDVFWYSMEGMRVAGDGAESEINALLDKLSSRAASGTLKGSGETEEERIDRNILMFLRDVQANGGTMQISKIANVPEVVLKMLLDARYLLPSLNCVVLTPKGENALLLGKERGML